uniref:hypothetical protein n=1 Tax=Paenibacillus kobensis TaxID=59841 RepID=UPI0013E36F03
MRARLYVIHERGKWEVHWSIAIEADFAYWRTLRQERRSPAEGREEIHLYRSGKEREANDGGKGKGHKVGSGQVGGGRAGKESEGGDTGPILLWRDPLPLGIAADAAERWRIGSKGGIVDRDDKAVRLLVRSVAAAANSSPNKSLQECVERVDMNGFEDLPAVDDALVNAVAMRLSGRAALLSEAQELLAAGPPACRAAAGSLRALSAALQL